MRKLFAAAAVSGAVALDDQAQISALQKVVDMLQEQSDSIVADTKKDAANYNKFACWCRDTGDAKRTNISDNEHKRDELQSDLEADRTDREAVEKEITDDEDKLDKERKAEEKTKHDKKEKMKKMAAEIMELDDALTQLTAATEALKAGRPSAFLQAWESGSLSAAAAALSPETYTALMQETGAPKVTYEFHSEKIVELLEKLHKDFTKQLQDSRKSESDERATFDAKLQQHADDIQLLEKSLKSARVEAATLNKHIGEANVSLTAEMANLNDNRAYLTDLVERCSKTKKMWDAKESARNDELHAVNQALVIIKDSMTEAGTDAKLLEVKPASIQRVEVNELDEPISLLQTTVKSVEQVVRRSRFTMRSPRDEVVDILENANTRFHTASLAALVTAAKGDPFAKVKKLIIDLIKRLQEEAGAEASHHSFCVKQTKEAKAKRDDNSTKVEQLNSSRAKGEENRDSLEESLAALKKELKDLKDALEKAEKQRETDKKTNDDNIKEAKIGREAIEKATKVLKDFYKSRMSEALLQEIQPVPESGFEGDDVGKKSLDAASGIFSMLEVINGDFGRTIKATEELEKEQLDEFNGFKRKTDISTSKKEAVQSSQDTELADQKADLQKDTEAMEGAIKSRDSALIELMDLKTACEGKGMSYEERTKAREDEIAALREAMKIFEDYKDL